MADDVVPDHEHGYLRTELFWNGRQQSDQRCRQLYCAGVARIQMGYAPDTGMNWLKCCCCGDEWNPGVRRG